MAGPTEEKTPDPFSAPNAIEVRYEYTPDFPRILHHINSSVMVTTYQAGKVLVLGVKDGKLQISFCSFDQPMGVAVQPERLAIGSRRQIHCLVAAHEVAASVQPEGTFDSCYVPRTSQYTGNIHVHDLAWGSDGLWAVNTLFSCLCSLHESFSFVPRWRPPFISQLADQDRCHLNGLAMEAGAPKYVTALSQTDEPAGWRPTKATSGCVMHVPDGEVVLDGLSMPHSPRLHDGKLWVLNSGHGSFGYADLQSGSYQNVEEMPGFTRGLALAGQFAFVGLSKIRETSVFGGIPIAEDRENLKCGVGIVDLVSGRTVAVFQFHSGVTEIFGVDVLPGVSNPVIAGSTVDEQHRDVWIVPPEESPRPVIVPRLPLFAGAGAPGGGSSDRPASAAEFVQLAERHQAAGRIDEAIRAQEQAVATASKPAPLLVNLGNMHQQRDDQAAALLCYQRAAEHDPTCVPALQNLGYLLFNRGEPEKAEDVYQQLVTLQPTALNKLLAASVLPIVYDSAESMRVWRAKQTKRLEELHREGATVSAADSLVPTAFFWAYHGENDRPVMKLRGQIITAAPGDDSKTTLPSRPPATLGESTGGKEHREVVLESSVPTTKSTSTQKLRVGFLSAYFRNHTIGRLNLGRVEQLDRSRFHVTVAAALGKGDEFTARFREASDRFVTVPRDVAAARKCLRDLNLDVLIFADVGMDALCSTLAFSRMAPLQCVTWGHPETTGSPHIDCFLSSELLETPDADSHYTERLIRLRQLGIYYHRPPAPATSDRSKFGLANDKHVYLCPQTLFKFHPDFDPVLRDILETDPAGELVLLEGRVPAWTERLRSRFQRTLGPASTRVRFLSAQSHADYLELLSVAEVILDPLHFGGGNTSYEALAMGTPIVTLPSRYLRGRITSALYEKMGIKDLICDSHDAYVAITTRLATDTTCREETSEKIDHASGVLFDDPDEVHALEEWLISAAT